MGGGGLLFPFPLRLRGEEKLDSSGLWRLSQNTWGKNRKSYKKHNLARIDSRGKCNTSQASFCLFQSGERSVY